MLPGVPPSGRRLPGIMAPHHAVDEHHMAPSKRDPSPLSVTKSGAMNAAKAPYKQRDLQSAMHNAPQVRVIHIFAPKVIKTDVANFRSTVQKLTGRSKRRERERGRGSTRVSKPVTTVTNSPHDGLQTMAQGGHGGSGGAGGSTTSPPNSGTSMGYPPVGLWEKEELQRLLGDTCCVTDLVRCDSVDSGSYSFDSSSTGVDHSPTDSFSFYPQRDTAYSLGEIPAPFFGLHPHDMHSVFNPMVSMPLPLPAGAALPENGLLGSMPTSHVTDHGMSLLGFEVDSVGALPDVLPLGCTSSISSSGGSLFDLPRHHCRLSVQQPYNQGANFFESM